MVRPRKIPKNFIPDDWTETEDSEDSEVNEDNYPINNEQAANIIEHPVLDSEEYYDNTETESDTEPDLERDLENGLEKLAREWFLVETNHNVSKRGSDLFWNLAKKLFHTVVEQQSNPQRKSKSQHSPILDAG